jgi:hypothetical protein
VSPEQYVEQVRRRMAEQGYSPGTAELPGGPVLVGVRSQFKLRWMATKLHLVMVVAHSAYADGPQLERFTNDALDYADFLKGQFRGLQVGVVAVPVLVVQRPDAGAVELARTKLIRKFGKFAWPTVVDLAAGRVQTHEGRVAIGGIYGGWIRGQIALTLPSPGSPPG